MKTFECSLLLFFLFSVQIIAQNKTQGVELANKNCQQTDSLALLAFHTATDGNNWTNKWDLALPMNTWYGLILNNEGCVSSLILEDKNIKGTIPLEIGNLTSLRELTIASYRLKGNIPETIGNLTNLETLNLDADLTGSIPEVLGNLNNLKTLNLSSNDLSGLIPSVLGNLYNLKTLNLSANDLTGLIPNVLGNLDKLEILNLANNDLYGEIPKTLGNLSNLKVLNLSYNKECGNSWCDFLVRGFSGNIPKEIGNLTNVEVLDLAYNNLSGSIPTELANLTNLTIFDLSLNELSGIVNKGIGNLLNLEKLNLGSNNLNGLLRAEIGNLTQLAELNLSDNYFSGNIPLEFGNLTNLTGLRLNKNNLSGCYYAELKPLCDEINNNYWISSDNNFIEEWATFCSNNSGVCVDDLSTQCNEKDLTALKAIFSSTSGEEWKNKAGWHILNNSNLRVDCNLNMLHGITTNENGRVSKIDLSNNNLVGFIPAEIANLDELETLIVDTNLLYKKIPGELASLKNLSKLHLSSNYFRGCFETALKPLCNQLTDVSIDKGNNFAAKWIDFCETNAGDCSNTVSTLCHPADVTALKAIYNATNGDTWRNNNNWHILNNQNLRVDCNLGNLYGVSLNENGRVAKIDFYNNALKGELPAEIGNLSQLDTLIISLNLEIKGHLPLEIGNLSNLTHLDLSKNILRGYLPTSIGNLNKLSYLNLQGNYLEGKIPAEIGNLSRLTHLHLGDNLLGYKKETIPAEIGNLSNLTYLNLTANRFSGTIPCEIAELTNLDTLYLGYNSFTGKIPAYIGSLTNLVVLSLAGNYLEGIIPAELGNLDKLEYLLIERNNLTGCFYENLKPLCDQLTANFAPFHIDQYNSFDASWVGFCTNNEGVCMEESLNLSCNLNDITALKAIYNSTSGDCWTNNEGWNVLNKINNQNLRIDCNLGNLHGIELNANGRVEKLLLPENNLTGSLPSEISQLSELTVLGLASNNLTGPLPSELGNLPKLTSLGLSNNKIDGNIPPQLSSLSNLKNMFLATNQLSGNIPIELGNLNNLKVLVLAENNLTGTLPYTLSNLSKLNQLMVYDNQLSGCFDDALHTLCDQLIFDNPNAYVNRQNDFKGSWTNFCQCKVGACNTAFDLEINANTTYQNQYQTEGNIITIDEVCISTGQTVTYKATATTLNTGFEAKEGSELLIIPRDCE